MEPDDREWIAQVITDAFGSTRLVSRGRQHDDAHTSDGYVAELDGRPIGCGLWREIDGDAELIALVTTYRGAGAGSAILEEVVAHAREAQWRRLWLITTNDNTDSMRLYQRMGWEWVSFHPDAVTAFRHLKPELPATGYHGIAIRHEIEFAFPL